MKKIIFTILSLLFFALSAYAEKGDMAAGVNIGYGTSIETIYLGAKFQYGFTDEIRAEAAFNHSFQNSSDDKLWDFEATAHFLFPLTEKATVYPLGGFCFTKEYDGSYSRSNFGVNLGAGIECNITDALKLGLEAKYQFVSNLDQAFINLGITYKF